MQKMYEAVVNSPKTELVTAITATDTDIEVNDISVLLQPEGLAVIGNGEAAETIKYNEVEGNILKGCVRGFQGMAKTWTAGTRLARNFTAYDHDAARQNIEGLYDRLDAADTNPITLQHGLQRINAVKDTRFRLEEVKGRTLINLLGRRGDLDTLTDLTPNTAATVELDAANKVQGNYCYKVSIKTGNLLAKVSYTQFVFKAGKKYLVAVEAKNGNATRVKLGFSNLSNIVTTATKDSYRVLQAKISVSTDTTSDIVLTVEGAAGNHGFFDALRVYELSDAEYAVALNDDLVRAKYPYTTGVVGVENPYAIGTSGNLIPPFYEWEQGINVNSPLDKLYIKAPYEAEIDAAGVGGAYLKCYITVPVGTYTLSVEKTGNNAWVYMYLCKADKTRLDGVKKFTNITTTSAAPIIEVVFNTLNENGSAPATGLARFVNPMLTNGSESKPFKPQRKSMLAFQTELHADPTNGSDPDILFEQNGEYNKLAKWKKVVLDGSLNWSTNPNIYTGFKQLFFPVSDAMFYSGYITKYNGASCTNNTTNATPTGSDQFNMWADKFLYLTVANIDSGWGQDYSPTQDEIKAYFMGWRMSLLGDLNLPLYNGSGTKIWIPILGYDGVNGTQLLPVTVSNVALAAGWNYYNLLYRLAKETVKPVVTEGSLVLSEGDNLVEVGTGIVLRERANPISYGTVSNINDQSSKLSKATNRILRVYKNSMTDYSWSILSNSSSGYGGAVAQFAGSYDQSTAYSVTYTKFDKSPIVPITGTLAVNEKAQISDLTAGVAEALQRVSVVEQKKAEKDAPGWITPTLLNSWNVLHGVYTTGYKKVNSTVVVSINVSGGVVIPGTSIFRLPEGYRPPLTLVPTGFSRNSEATVAGAVSIIVEPNGHVNIGFGNTQNWSVYAYFEFDLL